MVAEVTVPFINELIEYQRIGIYLTATVILYSVTLERIGCADSRTQLREGESLQVVFSQPLVKVDGDTSQKTLQGGFCLVEDAPVGQADLRLQLRIVLVVYHNPLDALADCFCKYDVSFKMSRLTPGSYSLQVYYADPAMKYDKTGLVYKGEVEVALGKTVRVSLKPGAVLPES